ncbi:MAG TPA: hypothetical protein VKX96_06075 [Chloroflexota bacterium]|nr:hypothetical protein [Chloroflexota bacterium]
MYIFQIIGRAKTPDDAQRICGIFEHSLTLMQSAGYARGFCAINREDKLSILIQEEWYNLAGLRFWQQSEEYQRLRQEMEALIEGVWESHTYQGHS